MRGPSIDLSQFGGVFGSPGAVGSNLAPREGLLNPPGSTSIRNNAPSVVTSTSSDDEGSEVGHLPSRIFIF